MIDRSHFEQVRAEWGAIVNPLPPDPKRFAVVKGEADALIGEGRWTSGPSDMLSVLGRSRDELMHSRLISWLLIPTNRHGLGRRFLIGFADRLWPGDNLLRSGSVTVETEESGSAFDEVGEFRAARADIVVRGQGVTIVIENKLDAGEQPAQCERQYWGWTADAANARFVFLTPTGRPPTSVESEAAKAAWHAMSYAELRDTLAQALQSTGATSGAGRMTAAQYLDTLRLAVAPLS